MEYLQSFLKSSATGGQHGNHFVYWIPLKVFNQLPIKLWKYNRPPDKDRVNEIHNYMKVSGRMDGVIYLAYVENELVCYESNHRREALKGLDSLADILVDVIWDTNDDVIKEEFIRLNKCVSVPELYIERKVEIDQDYLRKVVNDFCETYKSHKTSSGKPQRPNFNRDNLLDDLYGILKENSITIDDLMLKLTDYNKQLLLKDKSRLTQKIIDKCSSSGLWLFAWNNRINPADFL